MALAVPQSSDAAISLALPHDAYPRHAQIVVLPATNAEADRYFGPVHRTRFERLRRIDGTGWIQAGLWQFTTGRGGAARSHQTIFAYGIHIFKGRKGARRALLDVKLKTRACRVTHLYARRFLSVDAQETLVFIFFTYREILVEAYYEYRGVAPASVQRSLQHTFDTQTARLAGIARRLDSGIHQPPTATARPTRTATAIPTATPTAPPTLAPTATVTQTATTVVTPTVTPTATQAPLVIEASMDARSYAPGQQATVTASVTIGGQPVVGAAVTASFDFVGQSGQFCTATTDAAGLASCHIVIPPDARDGQVVDVNVSTETQNGQVATQTSFTVRR